MIEMPLMEFKNVSDAVKPAVGLQEKSILRQETCVDDPSPVVLCFEMRVRETNENLFQTAFGEVLAKMPHSIGSHNSNVIVMSGFLNSVSSNLLRHEIDNFISDFHSQQQLIWEKRSQSEQKSSVSASHIDNGDILSLKRVAARSLIEGGMLDGIAVSNLILLDSAIEFEGIVSLPVDKGVMRWDREGRGVERVDVGTHAVVLLLGHLAVHLHQFAVSLILIRLLALLPFSLHKRNIQKMINFAPHRLQYAQSQIISINSQFPMSSTSAQIEEMAYYALTGTGPNGRQAAELQWRNFVVTLPIDAYDWLLEEHSQQVLLLFIAVLKQEHLEDAIQWTVMEQISEKLREWMRINGSFVRRNEEVMDKAVEGLLGNYVGGCLKRFFVNKNNEAAVREFLDRGNLNAHFRLYLFYHFIENVSTTDSTMPFVDYRSLSYNFQDSILPLIFDSLIPYFMNFEQTIELSELNALQQSLDLNDSAASSAAVEASLWQQFNKFTLVLFKLLEEVVTFRYNISYKQFDGDSYEQMEISFPESIIKKILGNDFLTALYNIISKLMKMRDHNYLAICLNCLHKILMAKTTYLIKDARAHFMITNLRGVYELFSIWKACEVTDTKIAVQIIECNIKLLTAFKLRELEELSDTSQDVATLYMNWIFFIRDLPLLVLRFNRDSIHSHNQLLLSTAELLKEICEYIHIQKMDTYIESFQQKCSEFTRVFIQYFVGEQQHTIFGEQPTVKIEDYKEPLRKFLKDILIIATANYQLTINCLTQACVVVYNDPIRLRGRANLLLILHEIINDKTKFFQNGIFGDDLLRARFKNLVQEETSERSELHSFAQVLKMTMDSILQYCSGERSDTYLNHCIILFVERYMTNIIEKMMGQETEENVGPTSEYVLYIKMRKFQEDISDEDFIYVCLKIISEFIRCKYFDNFEYIFQCLYEIINKTKLGMKRAYFKETQIYREMLALFIDLSQMDLDEKAIKWRTLLYKSIASLSFDDVLDSYRFNIRQTVQSLKKSLGENKFLKVLYDLTGICQSVDSSAVYAYFVTILNKEINLKIAFHYMFTQFHLQSQFLIDLLNLSYELINNRSQRLLRAQVAKHIYGMIEAMLPMWNSALGMIADLNDSEDISMQLYKVFNVMLKQNQINIGLLDHFYGNDFRLFVKLMLRNLLTVHQNISQYPEYLGPYYSTLLHLFTNDVLKVLFSNQDFQISQLLTNLLEVVMQQISTLRSLEDTKRLAPEPNSQTILEIQLQLVHNYLKFAYENKKYLHRKVMVHNIGNIWQLTQVKSRFIVAAMRLALDFGKQIRDGYANIGMITVIMFKELVIDLEGIIVQLGIRNQKDADELRRIVRAILSQDAEEAWLSCQLKDWFKSEMRYIELTGPTGIFDDY